MAATLNHPKPGTAPELSGGFRSYRGSFGSSDSPGGDSDGGSAGGGIADSLEKKLGKHWKTWTAVFGIATLILLYIGSRAKSNYTASQSAANTTTGIDPTTGLPYGYYNGIAGAYGSPAYAGTYDPSMTPDWASQLNATEAANTSLLQQIASSFSGSGQQTTTPPTTNNPPPTSSTQSTNPLVPFGQWNYGAYDTGKVVNINGQQWTEDVGGGGRVWGVPGDVPVSALNYIPIGTGPGMKQLLSAPKSAYH